MSCTWAESAPVAKVLRQLGQVLAVESLWALQKHRESQVLQIEWASMVKSGSVVKNLPANAGDVGSIRGSGRSPAGGNGQPTPVFLPEKSHGQSSLVGHRPRGNKELDMTTQVDRALTRSAIEQGCLTLLSHSPFKLLPFLSSINKASTSVPIHAACCCCC